MSYPLPFPIGTDAYGSKIYWQNTDPADETGWTQFANVTKINPCNPKVSTIKVTQLTDANNQKAETYIPGMVEGGEVDFSYVYSDTAYTDVENLGGTKAWYKIQLPDGSYMEFPGIITENNIQELQPDKALEVDVKIKVSGLAQFTME